jgi:SpoIID/LytB domain protein
VTVRRIPTVLAVTALTAAFVVAPTVASGARPTPVPPVIHDVAIPSVASVFGGPRTASKAAGATRPNGPDHPLVAAVQVHDVAFDLAGVTFDRTPPAGTDVQVRTHDGSGWSGWTRLDFDDDGPDAGSADARHARTGTAPVAAVGSDSIDIRVTTPDGTLPQGARVSLVDGGSSAADTSLGAPAGSAVAAVARPTIYTRAQWGADESLRTCEPSRLGGFKAVVVHHTVNANTYTADQVPALIRAMYAFHVRSLGWCDIGYQLLVDRFGRIWEGRKGSTTGFVMGAQAGGFNAETTGVAVIGTFTSVPFSAAARSAVTTAVAWEGQRSLFDPSTTTTLRSAGSTKYAAGVVVTTSRTLGHRDLSLTDCPGDVAYTDQLPSIRASAGAIWRAGQWSTLHPQRAYETYERPSSSTLTLAGHGFGHGIGMSQWGAYGAARSGLTWQQILAFYYPGTSRAVQGDQTLRVWLSAVGTAAVPFAPQGGLVVSDGTRQSSLAAAYRWRVAPEGSALSLQVNPGTGWASVTGWRGSTRPLTISRPSSPTIRVVLPSGSQRDYAGSVRVSNVGGRAYAVNLVPFETYVRDVVPAEMPASWSPAALSAQAVAARTYAANQRASAGSSAYDICDVACQVYPGVADYSASGALTIRHEDPRSTAATTATAGVILTASGTPAFTQFSASNGGHTVQGGAAYLPAKADPYDGAVASSSNPHSWTTSVAAGAIERAYPATGTFRALRLGARDGAGDWGGRTTALTVIGSSGAVTVTAASFRARLGLRSTWWTVTSAPPRSTQLMPRDLTGDSLPDAIYQGTDGVQALAYSGAMSFTSRLVLPGTSGWKAIAGVGPWGPDNLGDLLALDRSGNLWYYQGLGVSGFAPRQLLATGWTSVDLLIPVGDFSGDGRTDFLARTTDGRLILYRGDGTGRIASSTVVGHGWDAMRQITSGDFDGNGTTDLLAVRASDGAVAFYPGTGSGGFGAPQPVPSSNWSGYPAVRGIGDLTGDGRDDVLVRSPDGSLSVLRVIGSLRIAAVLPAGTLASSGAWGQ